MANKCGVGPISGVLEVKTTTVPSKIDKIKVDNNCKLKFTWQQPKDNGEAIQKYDMKIKVASGEFELIKPDLCARTVYPLKENKLDESCEIDIQRLRDAPYNLEVGSAI
jgi:hypothetical protein